MAGLLPDIFSPQYYGGQGGGLLDLIQQSVMQQNQYQPSAGFNPPAQLEQQQASPIAVGGYQMPRIGAQSLFQSDGGDLPVNAQPAQGVGMPQITAQPAGPDFGDRLMAGFQGFANSDGLLPAIANGISGLATGQRNDPAGMRQQSQKAIYEAVLQQPGMTKQKAFIIATNPKAFEAYSSQLFDNNKYAFQTLPDGTIVRQDPRTGEVAPAYQSQPKADFGVVGEQDGTKTYGWIDKNKRTVTPSEPATARAETVTGPDGKQIPIPPGVDRKEFIKKITDLNADVAGGKMTEVQAKSQKFGSQMELSERVIKNLEGEGTSRLSRATEGSGWLPGSASIGRSLQSDEYQKYVQARNSFITALLRDESGAAIGTDEFNRRELEMFPQPGDGPAVIAQKRELRKVAIEGMKSATGPGYKSPADAPKSDGGPSAGSYMWMPGKGLVAK